MTESKDLPQKLAARVQDFIDHPTSGGICLMAAALCALIVANSPLAADYVAILGQYVGGLSILHWINDGLMALFFLLVGLEIKREAIDGELSSWPLRVLPGCAALGGMVVPALVFLAFNSGADGHPRGWAIPAATDIAFALGILSLLGSRVPASLRVFLTALAIIDDLGAIVIIALFYTGDLNLLALGGAAVALIALVALNRAGVAKLWPYLAVGAILWFLVLQSGVHATLAGVALALAIPLRPRQTKNTTAEAFAPSPLVTLEHAIAPWVTFLILPVFGFANAGVSFTGFSFETLAMPLPIGSTLGLFLGKQVGVFLFALAAIRMGWAALPDKATWTQLYGVALLCGIGFTMSLFIGLLAFPTSIELQDEVKLGVLLGSTLSALAGALLLRLAPRAP